MAELQAHLSKAQELLQAANKGTKDLTQQLKESSDQLEVFSAERIDLQQKCKQLASQLQQV